MQISLFDSVSRMRKDGKSLGNVIQDLQMDITVQIKPRQKYSRLVSFGHLFFMMHRGTFNVVTIVNKQVTFPTTLKCLRTPLLIVKSLMFGASTSWALFLAAMAINISW